MEGVGACFVQGHRREAIRDFLALRFSCPIEFPLGTGPQYGTWSQGSRSHCMTTEASRLAPLAKARMVKFIEFSLSPLPFFSSSPIPSFDEGAFMCSSRVSSSFEMYYRQLSVFVASPSPSRFTLQSAFRHTGYGCYSVYISF